MNQIKEAELKLVIQVSRELLRNNKEAFLELKELMKKHIEKLK
tara:strand:+ start:3559 stop:3687 length:129 start_codon:yes stop_codon:yes gene_type:complete